MSNGIGIGYEDSIILYNRYENKTLGKTIYYGTRFDGVRVEITQGANIRSSGIENADSITVKIPNVNLPKPYLPPEQWNDKTTEEMLGNFTVDTENKNFFVIVKKEEISVDIGDLPVGEVDDADYVRNNFFQYVKNTYGYAYQVHTFDSYKLIPRFEIGGR